jgi:hypothetical protein
MRVASIAAAALLLGGYAGCDRLFPYSAGRSPSSEARPLDGPLPHSDGPRPLLDGRRSDTARVDRGIDIGRRDSPAADSGPVCASLTPPAPYCADQLGCLMACKQSSTCCYQNCVPSVGGTLFKNLFLLCLGPGSACGSQCSSITSASCLGCLESTCTSQLKACVADRPPLGSALNCAEWLACILSCKGGATPGACVLTCSGFLAPASQAAISSLKLCGEKDCRGCVDPTQGSCLTGTLLGCLQQSNSCTTSLEACWKDNAP